jgi:hypothetical protein
MDCACKAIGYASLIFFEGEKKHKKRVVQPVKSKMKFQKSGAEKKSILPMIC